MTSDLTTRLSKLEGPNRRLDHEMHILFFVPDNKKDTVEWNHFGSYSWWPSHNHIKIDNVPAYTASIDAAIALAERVLPGWYWGITQGDDGEDAIEFQGNVWPSIQPYPAELEQYGYHRLPAVSLLIALLRAKEAST